MLTKEQIEKLHDKWYDRRRGMPPASQESFIAGWDAAMLIAAQKAKEQNKPAIL